MEKKWHNKTLMFKDVTSFLDKLTHAGVLPEGIKMFENHGEMIEVFYLHSSKVK